ncbi:MAG: hypothetical protein IKK34_00125 [Clostridia bacterium]|nr:hypothetical protein [Clostridia bacterium]
MKRKWMHRAASILILALALSLAWLCNALFGNPISRMLAERTARRHLAQEYAGTDYEIERIGYSFKDSNYHAFIRSPSSADTEFTLYITMRGRLRLDTYDDVLSGFNTALRLEHAYRELADAVFEDPAFPYNCHIAFGTLEVYPRALIRDPNVKDVPDYAIVQDELVIDGEYDIRELGRQAGHLIIYTEQDEVDAQRAAEIMLDMKARFDEAEIPFAAMDFTLWRPKNKEGKRPKGEISVAHFPYDAIYAEEMRSRVEEAHRALEAYYAEMDAQKQLEQ